MPPPMPPTKQRLIDGPERDLLTMVEVATYLGMDDVKTLRRLISAGEFPRGLEMSARTILWPWRDVLYWIMRAELKSRLVADPPKPRKKSQGQGGT